RDHQLARGNELVHRSEIVQPGRASQRLGALAASVERGIHVLAALLDALRDGLAHVTGAHDTDVLDIHAGSPVDELLLAAGGRRRSSKIPRPCRTRHLSLSVSAYLSVFAGLPSFSRCRTAIAGRRP